MKRSKSYVLRSLGDEWFLIPRGEKAEEIKGVLNLSETAAFIYNHIEETEDAEALEDLLEREYHATDEEKKEMRADIQEVLQFFYDYGMNDRRNEVRIWSYYWSAAAAD